MKPWIFTLLTILSLVCQADNGGWIKNGTTPASNTNKMKSIDGFAASLVVTPDKDWSEKWNTSPDSIPYFTESERVFYGQELTILTFFSNPKTTPMRMFEIACDIKVVRPDGTLSVDLKDAECGSGLLQGDPQNIRMTWATIKFTGDESDPPGRWTVAVVVTDKIRGTAVPLMASFELQRLKSSIAK